MWRSYSESEATLPNSSAPSSRKLTDTHALDALNLCMAKCISPTSSNKWYSKLKTTDAIYHWASTTSWEKFKLRLPWCHLLSNLPIDAPFCVSNAPIIYWTFWGPCEIFLLFEKQKGYYVSLLRYSLLHTLAIIHGILPLVVWSYFNLWRSQK